MNKQPAEIKTTRASSRKSLKNQCAFHLSTLAGPAVAQQRNNKLLQADVRRSLVSGYKLKHKESRRARARAHRGCRCVPPSACAVGSKGQGRRPPPSSWHARLHPASPPSHASPPASFSCADALCREQLGWRAGATDLQAAVRLVDGRQGGREGRDSLPLLPLLLLLLPGTILSSPTTSPSS